MSLVKVSWLLAGTGLITTLTVMACGSTAPTPNASDASDLRVTAPVASAKAGQAANPAASAFQSSDNQQWLPVMITDRTITAPKEVLHPGVVQLHVINAGEQSHELSVTGNGAHGTTGLLAAGKMAAFQGSLDRGQYQLTVDAVLDPPGPSIMLTVH